MVGQALYDVVWSANLPLNYAEGDQRQIIDGELVPRHSCRAFRRVRDTKDFLFLKISRNHRRDSLKNALKRILRDGIFVRVNIDGYSEHQYLLFGFFGVTESSLKLGQVILLRQTSNGTNFQNVLDSFGDLRSVFRMYGPGMYAARLGLSFSSTMPSIIAPHSKVTTIDDVMANDGVYTTDGCGIIRETFAQVIRSNHDYDSSTAVFQIRRGGVKGLLVAYPDHIFDEICRNGRKISPNVIPGRYVLAYRRSMEKYSGGPLNIEINNISEPTASARLNYSFIVLLLSLGTRLQPFQELLKEQLRSIEMIAHDRQEALHYVKGELDAQSGSSYQELFEMLLAGHSMDEPYLREKLRQCQNKQYNSLKKKLNIRVSKSCYVYGVVDELGVLKEDEVYLSLPRREGVIVSDVLVARNPSYKAGDIRKLKSVDKPELRFLTNCIVFPLRGEFSIPGSISGGDLDGDNYFVCWELSIMPSETIDPTTQSHVSPALTETGSRAMVDWRQVNMNDALVDLFVEQHHNTLLGRLATEWKNVVEQYSKLACAKYPMELAKLIEEALDMLKNGGSCDSLLSRFQILRTKHEWELRKNRLLNRQSLPDKLRSLIPDPSVKDDDIQYILDPALSLRDQRPNEWKKHFDEGTSLISNFNRNLRDAIERDEAEGEDERQSGRREKFNISHADYFKMRFIDKYYPSSPGLLSLESTESFVRASAWYEVGYGQGKPAFAWLGARYLNNIKACETNNGQPGIAIGALKQLD